MTILLANVRLRVSELLNESDDNGAAGAFEAGRWKIEDVDLAILAADGKVYSAIGSNPNNPHHAETLTGVQNGIVSGTLVNSRSGPVESVTFVVTGGQMAGTHEGTPWPATPPHIDRLRRLIQNLLGITNMQPRYILDGDTMWHNGEGIVLGGAASVSVNLIYPEFIQGVVCQSPDEEFDAVVCGAMASLVAKDGARVEAASYWAQRWASHLARLYAAQTQDQV